jgi:glucokinase
MNRTKLMPVLSIGLFILMISCSTNSYSVTKHSLSPEKTYIMGGIIGRFDVTLGVFELVDYKPQLVLTLNYKTSIINNFADFFQGVVDDLKENEKITIKSACFGVPGNTQTDKGFIHSHHSFAVDGNELMQRGLLESVAVINDFELQGYGIGQIAPENIIQINKGIEVPQAPKAIIGAGTGLGSALIVQCWDTYKQTFVFPLGACFMDFAPQTQAELDFAHYLNNRTGQNAAWGKVLGATGGITVLYDYLGTKSGYGNTDTFTDNAIFDHYYSDQHCKDAVDLYLTLYAQLIRTMIYAVLPHGGVYITNTIATDYTDLLTEPTFFEEILTCHNDWFKPIVEKIPVYVVTDKNISLYGAAHYLIGMQYV